MSSRQRCQILLKKERNKTEMDGENFSESETPHSLYLCVFI